MIVPSQRGWNGAGYPTEERNWRVFGADAISVNDVKSTPFLAEVALKSLQAFAIALAKNMEVSIVTDSKSAVFNCQMKISIVPHQPTKTERLFSHREDFGGGFEDSGGLPDSAGPANTSVLKINSLRILVG